MKTEPYFYPQPNHLPRTAIAREQKQFIQIAFAVHLSAVISAERYRSDSGALKSAVFNFVFSVMLKNKIEQSAKTKLLLNNPTDRTFGNRWSRYKEPSKNKAEAYRVYVEHLFLRSDAGDARIFSKEVIHDGLGRISYTAKEGEVYIDGTNDQTQTGWNISSAIHYDKLGRKTEEGMPFFYGGNLEQELVNKNSYEALEAFYELNNFTTIRNGSTYEYDDIDRPTVTTLPDGHKQKNEYSIESALHITKAIDPLENISISKKDARGNIREVERLDKNNNLLTKARYEYSVLGEMLRAYDANENLLSVTYDLLGRRTSIESKDTGKKEWIYDDKGRLYAETDSVLKNKAAEIRYEYDGLDRIIKIDYPFSQDIEYKYGAHGQNGAGQIVYKKDETGETHYKYGELNEVIKESRTINRYGAGTNPETASFEYRSDYLGRMQRMKYPDGETITYTYDAGGQLKGVSGEKTTNKGSIKYSYVDKILYDEHAQRVYIKYGNGVETRYKYDEKRRWLDSIETKNVQTQDIFQKIKYNFDAVGNVLGYNNDATTYETSQSYTYDNLYQLISVEGTSNQYKGKKSFGMTPVSVAKYKQTFSFDNIGNMTNKLSTTNIPGSQGNSYPKAELDYSLDYEYDPAYAHRLIKAGTRYYRYDANGNITAEKDGPFTDEEEFVFTYSYDPETDVYGTDYGFGLDAPKETEQANPQDLFAYRRNYTWNERNLLSKSSDRNYTVYYRYGEDGQRALKYTDEGRSETLYFNNFFTIHIPTQDQNNPQGLRVHKHIFVGNSRLVTAMTHTDNQGDNEEQKAKRYYYHSDHLGSAQFVTDWNGRQYEHIEYTPYGELWIEEVAAGLDKLPFRFTGKELDEETGLYYYGARYLDPKYSRWLSGDPALNDYIPKAPIDDEAKKHNENLPGMGGIYNTINLHVYHYAGNNPVKYIDPDGRLTADEETAKKIENLGKNAPGKLIDEILLKLKEDGWTIVTDEEKKEEVHDSLKESASKDNKDMMVSIDSTPITIKKDFTEEEKDQIELNKKIDAIPNDNLHKKTFEKLKRDIKPKDITLTMIIFKVNPYDFEKKQILGNYKEYIDIDNDGNIDGYKYK
ncbi:RHS repeat-associated core domain-containing protein [Treponema denticola]|uniref:RHS repeat domain-containing protein n=1 Tax=Treponema denticola TaxID=158 RepID=UPI0020A43A6F|nr:RHS repeat-associated core domain-containing protein [Treponema denticola]UTC95202.1 RHS repeat-associated core domain-containing protein [Treponema denticola]